MAFVAMNLDADQIAGFCRRHGIRRLALYGSVARGEFKPDSDVDVLAEFEPNTTVGWDIVQIERELSELVGRPIDLKTPGFLSRHVRDQAEREAMDLYVAGPK